MKGNAKHQESNNNPYAYTLRRWRHQASGQQTEGYKHFKLSRRHSQSQPCRREGPPPAIRMLLLIYPRGMRAKMAERERDAHYLYDRHNTTIPSLTKAEIFFSGGTTQKMMCTFGFTSHLNNVLLSIIGTRDTGSHYTHTGGCSPPPPRLATFFLLPISI